MDTFKMRFPWFGVGLIVVGAAMLLHRLGVVRLQLARRPLGNRCPVRRIQAGHRLHDRSSRGGLLGDRCFLVLGGYQMLEALGVVYISSYLLFPWTVVLVGVGFLMMFAVRPRKWHVIVPALFFYGTGSV